MRTVLVAICVLSPAIAAAHEIGATHVRLIVGQGHRWTAVITTGPQSLLQKLEAEAGLPRSPTLDAASLESRLEPLVASVARHIDLRFDGVPSPATLSITQLEVPGDVMRPSFVVLSATGAVPNGARIATWSYGLSSSTYAVVLVRDGDTNPTTTWVEGDATSDPLSLEPATAAPRLQVIGQYVALGFEHILPHGIDHILFVLGIFLLTTRLRPVLVQITAFTLAHSLTLGLTICGVVSLSPRVVEPLIALSIAYVAVENVLTPRLTPWRPVLVFAFGLLHGMGFAGVLRNQRLPGDELIPALVGFNAGIELAQLTVIAIAFASVTLWYQEKPWYRARVVVPASAAIAVAGLLWTVRRVIHL